jgi:hypothetical protein
MTAIANLEAMPHARPSDVATVLQHAGLLHGSCDLYPSTAHAMHGYAPCFAGELGFKNEATARRRLALCNRGYRHFEREQDRAGPQHAYSMALAMCDRVRWPGMRRAANLCRPWCIAHFTGKPSGTEADAVPPSALVQDNIPGKG